MIRQPVAWILDPTKILKKHEKEKWDKYLEHYLACRKHFTPLAFLVKGMQGSEAQACK
jgi:hypothetical protein